MIDFFTKQERIVIIFLVVGLIVGAGLKILKIDFLSEPVSNEPAFAGFEQQILAKDREIDSIYTKGGEENVLQQMQEKLKIDINTADFDQMLLLPHVGPVMAKRIIEYRNKNGKFGSVEELRKVKGIGIKTLEKLKPFIIVTNKE